jgi:hypothetical protein
MTQQTGARLLRINLQLLHTSISPRSNRSNTRKARHKAALMCANLLRYIALCVVEPQPRPQQGGSAGLDAVPQTSAAAPLQNIEASQQEKQHTETPPKTRSTPPHHSRVAGLHARRCPAKPALHNLHRRKTTTKRTMPSWHVLQSTTIGHRSSTGKLPALLATGLAAVHLSHATPLASHDTPHAVTLPHTLRMLLLPPKASCCCAAASTRCWPCSSCLCCCCLLACLCVPAARAQGLCCCFLQARQDVGAGIFQVHQLARLHTRRR